MSDLDWTTIANNTSLVHQRSSVDFSPAPPDTSISISTVFLEISNRMLELSSSLVRPSQIESTTTTTTILDPSSTLFTNIRESISKHSSSGLSMSLTNSISIAEMSYFTPTSSSSADDSSPTLSSRVKKPTTTFSISQQDSGLEPYSSISNFSSKSSPVATDSSLIPVSGISTSQTYSAASQTTLESISRITINDLNSKLSGNTSDTSSATSSSTITIDWASTTSISTSESVSSSSDELDASSAPFPSVDGSKPKPSSSTTTIDPDSTTSIGRSDSVSLLSTGEINANSILSLNTIIPSLTQLGNIKNTDLTSFFAITEFNSASQPATTSASSILTSDTTGSGLTPLLITSDTNTVATKAMADQISAAFMSGPSHATPLNVTDSATTSSNIGIFYPEPSDQVPLISQFSRSDAVLPETVTRHLMNGMRPDPKPSSEQSLSGALLESNTIYSLSQNNPAYHRPKEEYSVIKTNTFHTGLLLEADPNSQQISTLSRGDAILTGNTNSHFHAAEFSTSKFGTEDPTETGPFPTMDMAQKGQLARIDGSGSSMALHGQTTGVLVGTVIAAILSFGAIFYLHRRCYHIFFRPRKETIYIMHDHFGDSTYESPYREISRFSEES